MNRMLIGLLVLGVTAALAAGAQAWTHHEPDNYGFFNACARAAHDSSVGAPWDPSGMDACSKSIDTEPLSDKGMAFAHVNRGILRAALKHYKWAIDDFDSAAGLDPYLAEAPLNRAWAEIALKQYAKALPDLDRALALQPKDRSRVFYNRGIVHEELGDVRAAYRDYAEAAQLSPNWDAPKQELARFKVVTK